MAKTGIVILNYNGGVDVIQCINSILKFVEAKHNILVIDNSSTDKSGILIQDQFPTVEYIGLPKNEGYGAAMNRGFTWANNKGLESVILLNHDILAFDDFVTPLLENKADIVGPVIGWHDKGKLVFDLGGKIIWPWGRPVHLQSNYRPPAYNRKVDYLPGCCLRINLSILDDLGGFDPMYFLYFEDTDFCLRAKDAGFKLVVEPRSYLMHKVSLSTGGKQSPLSTYYLIRNNLYFIWKFGSTLQSIAGTSYIFGISIWIMLKVMFKGSGKSLAVLKSLSFAWGDALRNRRGFRVNYP